MTKWSDLFAGNLPGVVAGDIGKALMVRAPGAWVADFLKADDVKGVRTSTWTINTTGDPAIVPPISPVSPLRLIGAAPSVRLEMDAYGFGNGLAARRFNGTPSAPSAVKNNDSLFAVNAFGYGATGLANGSRVQINMGAAEDWTDTAQGTFIGFSTTAKQSILHTTRWLLQDNGHFVPNLDNAYDIGSPALRVRSIYGFNVAALSLVIGTQHKVQIFEAADNTYSRINMDTVNPSYWTWDVAQKILSWTGDNAAGPQFWIGDTASNFGGSVNVLGNVLNVGPTARVHLAADGAGTYGQVALDWQNLSAWRLTWATQDLNWLVNGTPVFNITGAGNAHVYGTLRVDGASSLGPVTVTGAIGATGNIHADGNLTANGSVTAASLTVNGSAFVTGPLTSGYAFALAIPATGANRWAQGMSGNEAAGNVGNDWYLNAFDNNATYLTTPLVITRATGVATFGNTVNAPTFAATNDLQINAFNGMSIFSQSGYSRFTMDKSATPAFWTFLTGDRSLSWSPTGGANAIAITAGGTLNAAGDMVAAGAVKWGGGVQSWLDTDGSSFTRVMLNNGQGSYLIYSWNTHKLVAVLQGVVVWSVDSAGNMVAKGAITPNGTPGLE
jgi:hypothetical protein